MTDSLRGKRVVITRPRTQAGAMAHALERRGAIPVLFPTIEIVPVADTSSVDSAIDRLADFDWIVFTSVNGVAIFFRQIEQRTNQPVVFGRAEIAAIGPATAEELERRGAKPQFVPSEYVADQIPDGLGDINGLRVLLPRASRARKDLANELTDRGALVEDLAVYDTAAPDIAEEEMAELERGVHAVTFTSSSSVEHFVEMTRGRTSSILEDTVIACIGPITAHTAGRLGLHVDIVAHHYTTDGIVEALATHFSDHQPSLSNTGS